MRTLMLSAIAAATVLAAVAVGPSTDANAASRHRAPHHNWYQAYNASGAFHTGRHPISGTPRWNAAGGGAP